jgi:hypothetical protein
LNLIWEGSERVNTDKLAEILAQRFRFDREAVESLIQQCVARGIKHDQLNGILTHIILHRRPDLKRSNLTDPEASSQAG